MQDTAWMDTCRRMRQDIWVEWRSIPLSYLHSVPVISIYRKITSVHWASDQETVGYWVLNWDASALNSSVKSLITNY